MTKSFWTTDRIIAETQHRCVLLMQAHVVPGLWDQEIKGPVRGYYDSMVEFARLGIANMYRDFGGLKGKATVYDPGFPAPAIRDWVDFLPPAPPAPTSKALGVLDRWLEYGEWVDPVRQGEPYDIDHVLELVAWAREIGVPIGEPTLEKAADGEFDLWEDADGDFEEAVGGTHARAIVAIWLVKHGYLAENDIQWLAEGWTVSREHGLGGKLLLYPPHITHTAWALVELALRHMTGSWPWSNDA